MEAMMVTNRLSNDDLPLDSNRDGCSLVHRHDGWEVRLECNIRCTEWAADNELRYSERLEYDIQHSRWVDEPLVCC